MGIASDRIGRLNRDENIVNPVMPLANDVSLSMDGYERASWCVVPTRKTESGTDARVESAGRVSHLLLYLAIAFNAPAESETDSNCYLRWALIDRYL
jgi:hypothetical protein